MSEAIRSLFRRYASEFADPGGEHPMSDTVVDEWIVDAVSEMSLTAWGQQYNRAAAYLTAHLIKSMHLDDDGSGESTGVGGPLSSRRAGDVAESYATGVTDGKESTNDLRSTSFGRAFLRLRSSRGARGPTTIKPSWATAV